MHELDARFMSGNDFRMTSVGEAELPAASDSDAKDEAVEDVEVDVSPTKDFGLAKQCKSKCQIFTF